MYKNSVFYICFLALCLSISPIHGQNKESGLNPLSGIGPKDMVKSNKISQVVYENRIAAKSIPIPIKGKGVAYAYLGYDPTFTLAVGPASFNTDSPQTINPLGEGAILGSFISGGTWANGIWYGVEHYNGSLYIINETNGALEFISTPYVTLNGMAWDGGVMYACSGTDLYTINLATGATTLVGPMGIPGGEMIALAHDGTTLYGFEIWSDFLYSIDPLSGIASEIGPLGIDIHFAQDAEFDKDNNILYLAGYNESGELYSIDTSTGLASYIGEFENGSEMTGFAIPYMHTNDLGILSIVQPVSGPDLGNTEIVTVRIKNYGLSEQSNYNIYYVFDGGPQIQEEISSTIGPGETYDHSFVPTIDLSAYGTYAIEAHVLLAEDENINNDHFTDEIENYPPIYCSTSYSGNSSEFISNVKFNTIDNPSSFTEGGYADYTNLSTDVAQGLGYEIEVEVEVGGPFEQHVWVWIDWNQNFLFTDPGEAYDLGDFLEPPGTYTLDAIITVPAVALPGSTRLRVAERYITDPEPCTQTEDGEAEDYSIMVIENLFPPPTNLVSEEGNSEITLAWAAPVGSYPDSYKIYRYGEIIGSTVELVYTDTDFEPGIIEYCVKAIYGAGESAQVCIDVPFLSVPQNMNAGIEEINDVSCSWDEIVSNSLTGYNLFKDEELLVPNLQFTEYLDENVLGGVHKYYVTAIYEGGESAPSEVAEVTLLLAPTNLTANADGDGNIVLEWGAAGTLFSGNLIKLQQHDSIPNGLMEQWANYGYGVVYDLSGYSEIKLETLDFRHVSYGTSGVWSYNVHIVDWVTFIEIAEFGSFQTSGDDIWEFGVSLGSMPITNDLVAVLLEPLSQGPDFMMPLLSTDEYPNGSSIYSSLEDFSFNYVTQGDYLMNLWILASESKSPIPIVKADKKDLNSTMSNNTYQNNKTIIQIMGQKKGQGKYLNGYNIYYSFDSGPFNSIALVADTSYIHEIGGIKGLHSYYITSVYDEGESEPSNEASVLLESIDEIGKSKICIFPNPTSSDLNIYSKYPIHRVILMDMHGKVVIDESLSNQPSIKKVVLDNPPGIYNIMVETSQGSYTERVVVLY